MLNRLDAKTVDTYNDLESTFSYLGEYNNNDDIDKSTNGNPVPDNIKEDGKRKGVIGKIGGIGADSNEPTRNNRRYPLELWQNVEKSEYFIEGMENRTLIGEADHPQERLDYSVKEGAVVLTKYEIQDDGKIYTEFDILDTLPGRTVKTYFDAGCRLGVSSRGLGEEIVQNGETIIDPQTYQFYCFDVVAFPAVKSARMDLIESTSPKREKLIKSITKEIKNCKSLNECLFIENMSKGVNLYLDEIKEAIDIRKKELEKEDDKSNKIENLFNQLKESTDEEAKKEISSEILKYISDAPIQTLIRNILFDPDNKIDWNKALSHMNELMPETIKKENNKIKISDQQTKSDEDTPDGDSESDLQILSEIQEKLNVKTNENLILTKQLEQKNQVIKSLMAKSYSQSNKLQEQANISKKLISNQKKIESYKEDLGLNNQTLESKLSEVTKKYKKLQKANMEFSTIIEALTKRCNSSEALVESLKKENKLMKKKNKKMIEENKQLTSKNGVLQESLRQNNVNDKDLAKLSENVNSLTKENETLKKTNNELAIKESKNSKIIKELRSDNSKLNGQYAESLEKYIEAICTKYNLDQLTLKRRLGENYTIKDIDKIAKELIENISKINSLPFSSNMVPSRAIINENIGLLPNNGNTKEVTENLEMLDMLVNIKNN